MVLRRIVNQNRNLGLLGCSSCLIRVGVILPSSRALTILFLHGSMPYIIDIETDERVLNHGVESRCSWPVMFAPVGIRLARWALDHPSL